MGAIVERVMNADSLQNQKKYSCVTKMRREPEHSPIPTFPRKRGKGLTECGMGFFINDKLN
jgi:hypothetical protein